MSAKVKRLVSIFFTSVLIIGTIVPAYAQEYKLPFGKTYFNTGEYTFSAPDSGLYLLKFGYDDESIGFGSCDFEFDYEKLYQLSDRIDVNDYVCYLEVGEEFEITVETDMVNVYVDISFLGEVKNIYITDDINYQIGEDIYQQEIRKDSLYRVIIYDLYIELESGEVLKISNYDFYTESQLISGKNYLSISSFGDDYNVTPTVYKIEDYVQSIEFPTEYNPKVSFTKEGELIYDFDNIYPYLIITLSNGEEIIVNYGDNSDYPYCWCFKAHDGNYVKLKGYIVSTPSQKKSELRVSNGEDIYLTHQLKIVNYFFYRILQIFKRIFSFC